MTRSLLLPILLCFFVITAHAEDSDKDLSSMSLEDLLKVKIQGAANEKRDANLTPAAVTVITAEDIRLSGSRDLKDVLSLAPGISFGTDTQGVIGIAVRGIWAHEGKALLIIDGEEMNELAFSSTQFGHEYPVDSIARVEVIRGPGSATHGGFGELAVINIISKDADDYTGVSADALYGQSGSKYGERTIGVGLAGKKDGWKLSSYIYGGQGQAGSNLYTDQTGSSYNFTGNAQQSPLFINLGASNDRWNIRFLYDTYSTTDRSAYGTNLVAPLGLNFNSINFGVSYTAPITETFSVIPELHLKRQMPWNENETAAFAASQLYYNATVEEVTAKVTARKEFSSKLNLHFGVEASQMEAFDSFPGGSAGTLYPQGLQSVSYSQEAAFSELNWDANFANFVFGGRYETQNVGGSALVPRFAALKEIGNFHMKAMYSWGFREPGIENLRLTPTLSAETTKVAEAELGYQFTPQFQSTANIYTIQIKQPIIYGYSNGSQMYQNSGNIRTYGVEWDNRYKSGATMFDANYSYFHPTSVPTDYQIPTDSGSMLGMANHKAVLTASTKVLDEKTRVSMSEIFYSSRKGYDYDPSSSTGVAIHSFREAYLTNFMLERSDVFIRGLDIGVGVMNALNQDFRYIQPYDGSHPPVPGENRDWILKLNYLAKF